MRLSRRTLIILGILSGVILLLSYSWCQNRILRIFIATTDSTTQITEHKKKSSFSKGNKNFSPQRASTLYHNFQSAFNESLVKPIIYNYGPNALKNYFHPSILNSQFFKSHPPVSSNTKQQNISSAATIRLRRRLQIAILKAQLSNPRRNKQSRDKQETEEGVLFTWATSGDSNAAGHGNLFTQSFTVVMETLMQPLFASLNIIFHAMNYGYGSSSSAPEFSLCQTAIYGSFWFVSVSYYYEILQ